MKPFNAKGAKENAKLAKDFLCGLCAEIGALCVEIVRSMGASTEYPFEQTAN